MRASKALWAAVLGAGLVCSSGVLLAQDCGAKGQMADKSQAMQDHMQEMKKQLNLSDDQVDKLKPIMNSQMSDMQAVKADTSLTPQQKRSKMMDIHQKYSSQINAILTPDQQAKWKAMRQEMMEKHKGGAMGNGGAMDHQ